MGKQLAEELTSYANGDFPKMKPLRGKAAAKKKEAVSDNNIEVGKKKVEEPSEESDEEEAFNMANLDPYDISDPVDIFKTFNEDWSEKVLKQAKWTEKMQLLNDFLDKAK